MKKRNQHESLSITDTIDSQQILVAQGGVDLFFAITIKYNMKTTSKLDTPQSALTAMNCTTHSVEVTFNMDLTIMFWPHPDIHEEILKEAEVDMENAVQVENALRDYANETVEGSALALTAWKHVADGTGQVTYYANTAIRPRQNIVNPKATHYARPVVGGVATDPQVKEAREFFNGGLPDTQAGTVTGRALYYGSASATTFSYAKTQATRPKAARKRKKAKKA